MKPSSRFDRRRQFLVAAGALLAVQHAWAQQKGKIHRVGYLVMGPVQAFGGPLIEAFREGLRELGYVEGRNLAIEFRSAEGKLERLDALAAELVRSKVDVIVAPINAHSHAAKRATKSIPIVMVIGTDVVAEGLVASLAKPGGNVTGLTWDVGLEIVSKRLELLKEAVPNLSRVAVLRDLGHDAPGSKRVLEEAGKVMGLTLIWPELADDLETAFKTAVSAGAQALFTAGGARLFIMRKQVAAMAAKYRLPDSHYQSEFVDAGGLMSYAPNLTGLFRGAARYVDRILKGARPGDLPVERPTRIELVINLKTAKALDLKVPQSLLLRADRVIE